MVTWLMVVYSASSAFVASCPLLLDSEAADCGGGDASRFVLQATALRLA